MKKGIALIKNGLMSTGMAFWFLVYAGVCGAYGDVEETVEKTPAEPVTVKESDLAHPATFNCETAMLAIFDTYNTHYHGTLIPLSLTREWSLRQASTVAAPLLCETYKEQNAEWGVLVLRRQYMKNGAAIPHGAVNAVLSVYVFKYENDVWNFVKGKREVVEEDLDYGQLAEVSLEVTPDGHHALSMTFKKDSVTRQGSLVLAADQISRFVLEPEPANSISVLHYVLKKLGNDVHGWDQEQGHIRLPWKAEWYSDFVTIEPPYRALTMAVTAEISNSGYSPDRSTFAALIERALEVPADQDDEGGFVSMELNTYICDLLVLRKQKRGWQTEYIGQVDESTYSGGTRRAQGCGGGYTLDWSDGRPVFVGNITISGPYAGGVFSKVMTSLSWRDGDYRLETETIAEGPLEEIQ